jgi:glutamyl-tRNA reductase
VLRADAVAAAMQVRHNRPLFIIDIAVPRDVEPQVGELGNVFLYDIDDLQQVVEANLAQRRREVPRVESIVQAEVAGFMAWFRALDVVPTIKDLRQHVERIYDAELQQTLRRLEHLPERERSLIQAFGQRLVNKILHQPTVRLKEHGSGSDAYRYAEAVRDLFGLVPPDCQEGTLPAPGGASRARSDEEGSDG